MLDVFGGFGFVEKTTNSVGLRGYVLDTKFGPKYDATKPLVLSRIRQDVSTGKRVAAMISPPRQHSSCSSKVLSASAALLQHAHTPWILEHTCDSWFWEVPKIQTLAAQPRTAWARGGLLFFQNTEIRLRFWLETWTAGICTVFLASVLGQSGRRSVRRLLRHALSLHLHVTTPALSVYLSRMPFFSP